MGAAAASSPPAPAGAGALQAVVICAPAGGDPTRVVGGITLLERILRQLAELDAVARILILKPAGRSLPPPSARVRKPVVFRDAAGTEAWAMLRAARADLEDRFILVAADFLVDQRLLRWLAEQPANTMLAGQAGGAPQPVAHLAKQRLDPAAGRDAPDGRAVAAGSLPSYWESMHGEVPLHLLRVTNEAEAEAGWRMLLDHVQRRAQELPSRYFDPIFENLIVRRLAGTQISANQVTAATTLLGFAVSALYFTGWLRVGALLGIAVEVLDGVDGKLARITRTTSRAGEYEHILDFFYENSWYLALGLYLARAAVPHALATAMMLVLFDLIDTLVYAAVDVRWGRSLDNLSPFLTRFRLVGGRRNIYGWFFLLGFFLGFPGHAFYAAAAWAGFTATVHLVAAIAAAPSLIRERRARAAR